MEYFVMGADGQEYGPASIDTLKQWVVDNRVGADTNLKEFQTGRVVQARNVEELFPRAVPTPSGLPPVGAGPGNPYQNPPAPYPRGGYSAPAAGGYQPGNADIYWAIGRSVVALFLFFVVGGLGLIIAAYGLMAAIRANQAGHRLGMVAIVISVVTLVILGIGWFFRLSARTY